MLRFGIEQVDSYIQALPSPQKEICERLRTVIATMHPQIEEKWGWSRPLYMAGGKYVCHIVANQNDVNLGFEHGAHLSDPKRLLVGTGVNMRHVKIHTTDELDLGYLQQLLTQAIALASAD